MYTLDQLITKYRVFGIAGTNETGELILTVDMAKQFIKDCYSNDLSVIGIEGFDIENKSIKPRMDMIADFSEVTKKPWKECRQICFISSLEFLNHFEAEENVGFEFVVIGEPR